MVNIQYVSAKGALGLQLLSTHRAAILLEAVGDLIVPVAVEASTSIAAGSSINLVTAGGPLQEQKESAHKLRFGLGLDATFQQGALNTSVEHSRQHLATLHNLAKKLSHAASCHADSSLPCSNLCQSWCKPG